MSAGARLLLLPLTRAMIEARLRSAEFTLPCDTADGRRVIRFGAEWPGDAIALFPTLLGNLGTATYVDGTFVIVERATGEAVGQVGTKGVVDQHGVVDIGYGVNISERRRGLATEAVGIVATLLLENPQIARVVAETAASNTGSQRVLQANGFTPTGTSISEEDGILLVWARE